MDIRVCGGRLGALTGVILRLEAVVSVMAMLQHLSGFRDSLEVEEKSGDTRRELVAHLCSNWNQVLRWLNCMELLRKQS